MVIYLAGIFGGGWNAAGVENGDAAGDGWHLKGAYTHGGGFWGMVVCWYGLKGIGGLGAVLAIYSP